MNKLKKTIGVVVDLDEYDLIKEASIIKGLNLSKFIKKHMLDISSLIIRNKDIYLSFEKKSNNKMGTMNMGDKIGKK